MKWILILLAACAVVIGGAATYPRWLAYWSSRTPAAYREVTLCRRTITRTVNATGTVQPVRRVQVGSVISGPIEQILVDFNSVVKKGDLMARIDARTYKAAVGRDEAACASARAEVESAQSQLDQARNDERRADSLRKAKRDFLSDAEMDRVRFHRVSTDARLAVAKAGVQQAESALKNSQANLSYTEITAPEDGVVIERRVDVGQAIAAQFQTPELFVVAPELQKHVNVFAAVDEADIGLIRRAEAEKRPVTFSVDAYPEENFSGKISQVRVNPKITQSVVTYEVIVEAANPQMKLLPGMTANITFEIDVHKDALCAPNSALRFLPQKDHARPEDRELLDLDEEDAAGERADTAAGAVRLSGAAAGIGRDQQVRYLWVVAGEFLKAVPVATGITDKKFTEIVRGDVTDKQTVIAGVRIP